MRFRCHQLKWCTLFLISVIILYNFLLQRYRTRCLFTSPESLLEQYEDIQDYHTNTDTCYVDLEQLGKVQLDISISTFDEIVENHPHVQKGGRWRPTECQARQKLAVVLPYRNRLGNLKILLNRLHGMLKKQLLDYRIFVVEQADNDLFNKGKLMNIGYLEALEYDNFDCFVFHDVDLLPENDKNLYMCNDELRHLSSAVDIFEYHVWYCNLVGGSVAVNRNQMKRINGFSNSYWGWGHEDDDFAARTWEAGVVVTNTPEDIGRYTSLPHQKEKENIINNDLFLTWRGRWMHDGLNNQLGLNYSALKRTEHRLYTNITVDVGSSLKYKIAVASDAPKESMWWEMKFFNL